MFFVRRIPFKNFCPKIFVQNWRKRILFEIFGLKFSSENSDRRISWNFFDKFFVRRFSAKFIVYKFLAEDFRPNKFLVEDYRPNKFLAEHFRSNRFWAEDFRPNKSSAKFEIFGKRTLACLRAFSSPACWHAGLDTPRSGVEKRVWPPARNGQEARWTPA